MEEGQEPVPNCTALTHRRVGRMLELQQPQHHLGRHTEAASHHSLRLHSALLLNGTYNRNNRLKVMPCVHCLHDKPCAAYSLFKHLHEGVNLGVRQQAGSGFQLLQLPQLLRPPPTALHSCCKVQGLPHLANQRTNNQ